MVRYLAVECDAWGREKPGALWDEWVQSCIYEKGDIVQRMNGQFFKIKFIEGNAMKGINN